ncbi:MAG: dihydrouridine synthase [Rhodocyclaceae bacterium]|nr:dihydrouridine synthase [Rhodocyclaceae bacterium]
MEGLADDVLRDVLTGIGGYDWCVTEFVRVSGTVLPSRYFTRVCPELKNGSRTGSGTPVRVQLMGSDPGCLAENAARLAALNPAGIDLNFGCPAPLVNRHGGGASLLADPELLHRIAAAVRPMVPAAIPFSAKMRLGIQDPAQALDCARALAAGGIDELVVHGRTKVDGYRPPARWEWIARVREAVPVPVIANGEIWNPADYERCRAATGCADVMLGRGAIADPLLARRLRGEAVGGWEALMPAVARFWSGVRRKLEDRHAPGRLKQWLGLLRRAYPEAEDLYRRVRPLKKAGEVEAVLAAAGILTALPLAA